MPRVEQSIVVDAPIGFTIEVSNDLEEWPKMMHDYTSVEILRREGWKIWFRLRDKSGSAWVSWRVVDSKGCYALAERFEPKAPFDYIQHFWFYQALGDDRTKMTWTMIFELPQETRSRESDACNYLQAHSAENQRKMKAYIEQRHRAGTVPAVE